jgi:hypothetical protein
MALGSLTFNLYSDAGLTSVATTDLTISAQSDLSDGYHDYYFYLGCTDTGQQLRASSNPGVDPIVITPTYILPSWVASTAYALNASIRPATPNGYRYVCTTAGTTGASAPTFGTTLGGTTTDGTCVWTLVSTTSSVNEMKLASTSIGLDSATAGASLTLGTIILSQPVNAVLFYVRVTNALTTVSSSAATPELGININAVKQSSV